MVGTSFGTASPSFWNEATARLYGIPQKVRKKITASRAFALVKRRLKRETTAQANNRQNATASMAVRAKENGQTALYEELSKRIAESMTDLKHIEAGFGMYLNRSAVDAFVRGGRTEEELFLTPIENFGRHIPGEVVKKLKQARDTGLFKAFTVLHAGKAFIKTAAEKIREKDPILFGVTVAHPDRFYFIADWIDEFCDLTLSELIVDEKFTGSLETVEVDGAKLAAEVAKRDELLSTTKPSNWRENEVKAKSLETASKPLWRIW